MVVVIVRFHRCLQLRKTALASLSQMPFHGRAGEMVLAANWRLRLRILIGSRMSSLGNLRFIAAEAGESSAQKNDQKMVIKIVNFVTVTGCLSSIELNCLSVRHAKYSFNIN